MADDIDIEAMLEAALQKNGEPLADEKTSRSRSKERQRDRSRSRDRKRRRESKRSRSRDRRRRSRSRRRRSRSPVSKRRSRSRDRRRSRERLPPPPRVKSPELTPEERDMRTVFCMQLAARIRPRDLEEFFSSVGRVRDVRLITDPRTKKSKGVAYVEFREVDSVNQAISLSGQKLLGVPIIVKPSNAEKNRQANPLLPILSSSSYGRETGIGGIPLSGPMKLYIGSLHFNITEDMLRGIFEPFGRIDSINLMRDPETNRSRGYAFLQFAHAEDAKRAMEQMNGFELAGRSIKVGHVTEKSAETSISSNLDSDELDQRGISLGATGRLALMAKLADGSGLQMPQVALNALNYTAQGAVGVIGAQNNTQLSPVGTQCFMLSNMFDPTKESFTMEVAREIRDDVIDECNKHGGLTHIYIDTKSPQGNVYVKCPSIATAITCVNSLHGRFFSGRVIQGNYIPVVNYHQLFPESVNTHHLLMSNNYR